MSAKYAKISLDETVREGEGTEKRKVVVAVEVGVVAGESAAWAGTGRAVVERQSVLGSGSGLVLGSGHQCHFQSSLGLDEGRTESMDNAGVMWFMRQVRVRKGVWSVWAWGIVFTKV